MESGYIKKNIYDLDCNHILNKQNIFLGFLGAALITTLFTDYPQIISSRLEIVIFILLAAIITFVYYNRELDKIRAKIEKLVYGNK